MKKIALILVVSFLFMPNIWGQKQQEDTKTYTLSEIKVRGAEYTPTQRVIEMSGLRKGDKLSYPSFQTSEILHKIWDEDIFSDVSLEAEKIVGDYLDLVIVVKERPRIASFSFQGVRKGQSDDLKEKINFISGTILTESKIQSAKRIIRNFFVEKGYYDTKVDIQSTQDKAIQNGAAVSISINKGRKIKIKDIDIEDNVAFSDKKILRKMAKHIKEKRIWRVWARSKFIPKNLEKAKTALIAAYGDKGYRDAQILMDTVYSHDKKNLNIRMKMYEGNQYYIRNINWVGNYKYNSLILKEVLGLKKGEIYSREKLDRRLSGNPDGGDVSSLYLDDGYLFYRCEPVEINIENDSVDLEMRVFEGPQATIRKVTIEGNNKTSDYVILRELRTVPGNKFSRADLIRSQREIISLGFFDQEKINAIPIPDYASGTVDLKYVVEEKPSDQLQLQGGWGARPINPITGQRYGTGFTGTLMVSFNNFSTKRFLDKKSWTPVPSGDGQKLNLSLQSSVGATVLAASFTEPWLGGKKPNSLSFSSSYSLFRFGLSSYKNGILNLDVDYGRRMKFPDDFFQSYVSLNYKYFDITNPGNIFPGFAGENRAFVNDLSFKYTIARTSLDAVLYPRSGSNMNLSVSLTPPYSMFNRNANYEAMSPAKKYHLLEYHKIRFSSDWYFRILGNLVLRTKVDAGFLGYYNKKIGTPPLLRYYLGGSGMMGMMGGQWDGREVIALRGYGDLSVVQPGGEGNTIFNKVSMELRYPITLNQTSPIWLLAFAEAGNGYGSFRQYNPFRLHRSVGVGGRIMLPMVGLLGLDMGYGFDNYDLHLPNGDPNKRLHFHFILGQNF
jgi:outer membrane protein insertion porin family